jgi:hypothetical protein
MYLYKSISIINISIINASYNESRFEQGINELGLSDTSNEDKKLISENPLYVWEGIYASISLCISILLCIYITMYLTPLSIYEGNHLNVNHHRPSGYFRKVSISLSIYLSNNLTNDL